MRSCSEADPETTMDICRLKIEALELSCPAQRVLGMTFEHLLERAERQIAIRDCMVPAVKLSYCDDMLRFLGDWNPLVPDPHFQAMIEAYRADALKWLIEDAPKGRA